MTSQKSWDSSYLIRPYTVPKTLRKFACFNNSLSMITSFYDVNIYVQYWIEEEL